VLKIDPLNQHIPSLRKINRPNNGKRQLKNILIWKKTIRSKFNVVINKIDGEIFDRKVFFSERKSSTTLWLLNNFINIKGIAIPPRKRNNPMAPILFMLKLSN